MPYRDKAGLVALLLKPDGPIASRRGLIPARKLGDGADPCCGIGENADGSPVAEADDIGRINGCEQACRFTDGNLRCLSLDHVLALTPNGESRVEKDGMPDNLYIEKVAERRQVLLPF